MTIKTKITVRDRALMREASVLEAARRLSAKDGYLALRMADLASEAEISIGSLYRHFQSKEDVIAGLAAQAWKGRLRILGSVLDDPGLDSGERLIAAVLSDILFSLEHPELFGAEELAATRAVRAGASDGRLAALKELHERIVARIVEAARRALSDGAFEVQGDIDSHAQTIDLAIWTLMAGTSHIVGATQVGVSSTKALPRMPIGFIDVCAATFSGLGWCEANPRHAVARLADRTLESRTSVTKE